MGEVRKEILDQFESIPKVFEVTFETAVTRIVAVYNA